MTNDISVIQIGPMSQWVNPITAGVPGRRFLEGELGLTYIGLSASGTAPGAASMGWHRHEALEEVYIFLAGRGEMALDEAVVPVSAGTVIRVAPHVMRAWRCLPDSPEPLAWMCVRAGGKTLADIGADHTFDRDTPRPWSAR